MAFYQPDICRVCQCEIGENSCYTFLDDVANTEDCYESASLKVYEQIEFCYGVRIRALPNLPNKVCQVCMNFVWEWYRSRSLCLNSQIQLESMCSDSDLIEDMADVGDDEEYFDRLYNKLQLKNRHAIYNEYSEKLQMDDIDDGQAEFGPDSFIDVSDHFNFDTQNEENKDNCLLNGSAQEADVNAYYNDENQNEEDSFEEKYSTSMHELNLGADDYGEDETLMGIEPSIDEDAVLESYVEMEEDAALERVLTENATTKRINEQPKTSKSNRKSERLTSYMCSFCGNLYTKKSRFKAHMDAHLGIKNYQCDICSKRFRQLSELNAHMRRHTGEKPYKCAYCDRCFASTGERNRHERVHTNDRPYKCTHCDACFSSPAVLKNHIKTHTGEKNHKCTACEKAFTLQHQLKAHLQTKSHLAKISSITKK